ncbi:MAG: hypothetical protein WBP61_05030 [Nocardioides sp.]
MRDPDEFDHFYKDVRGRLLLLTYCLTGDLPSSRAAVRDAFVATWHHWRKVSRLEDPEAWTRTRACTHAQRRHTAKLWHREKNLDDDVRATLDALGKLPVAQRRVLLLTELTQASMAEISREVALPRTDTERELQTATAQFSVARDVPTTSIRTTLEAVRAHLGDSRWPRPTIIRRAGATRRRTHTAIGVAATVAALVVTGTLITDTTGVRPTLSTDRAQAAGGAPSEQPTPEPVELPEDTLLTPAQVGRAAEGGSWAVTSTEDGSSSADVVMPCQESRYAATRPVAALTRVFDTPRPRRSEATAVQSTVATTSDRAAERAYDNAVDWFAGCTDERTQLVSTHAVEGVGDEGTLFVLRAWSEQPAATVVAGVARTGRFLTIAVHQQSKVAQPPVGRSARLLGQAVSGLCGLEGAGACTTSPKVRSVAPVPVADVPSMLGVVDLPPITGVSKPWVATPPRQARKNLAATQCDTTAFTDKYQGTPVTRASTGSFLILRAKLPDVFGLTETQGALPRKAAHALVDGVRSKLAACADKVLGTTVRRTTHVDSDDRDLTVWHVTSELSDKRSLTISMAILRNGTGVAQLGFVPAPGATMSEGQFEALAQRALQRLEELPPPSR